MELTGAQIVVEVLCEMQVDTLFGYPGGSVLNLYDALYQNAHRIRHVVTAHEQGAAHAADGYARVTGKPGVVLATSGPGATNLVTGIATAYMDSVPMVAITGNVNTDLLGRDSFQEVYIAGITMPITKHNFVVRHIEDLAHDLREAFRIAASGRPGPVLVDIPKDITAQVCEYVRVEKPAYDRPCAPREELLKAAAMLAQAERPLLYVGGGAVSADCTALLQEIAERLDLPVCYTMMGTGLFRWDDPRSLGMIGMHGTVSASRAAAAADVILAVGTRFSDRTATDKAHFIAQAQLIQLDIDPAEMGKNIPVACAMVGDVAATLQQLLPLLHPRNHPMWWNVVRTFQGEDETPIHPPDTLSPYAIMEAVTRVAGEEAILTTDVGQHQMWAVQYGRRTKPRTFLTSGGLGTMGYGYGAAMGAQVAAPDRPVIHLTGDGSFHMNLNELATAVSFQLPVVTVVFNNRVLGMVRQWQKVFYEGRYAYTTLDRQTDYVKLAEAFGALGFRCTTKTELEQALHTALEAKRPAVIDCPMDCDERVLPMIPPGKNIDDVIRA